MSTETESTVLHRERTTDDGRDRSVPELAREAAGLWRVWLVALGSLALAAYGFTRHPGVLGELAFGLATAVAVAHGVGQLRSGPRR